MQSLPPTLSRIRDSPISAGIAGCDIMYYNYWEPFATILVIDRREKSCTVDDIVQAVQCECKILR